MTKKLRRRRTSRGPRHVRRNPNRPPADPVDYHVRALFSRDLSDAEREPFYDLAQSLPPFFDWINDRTSRLDGPVRAAMTVIVQGASAAQAWKNALLTAGREIDPFVTVTVTSYEDDGPGLQVHDAEEILHPQLHPVEDVEDEARRSRELQQSMDVLDEILEEEGELEPNPRARPIGDRPSMDTRFFGKDLDDEEIDSVAGAEGRHLDAAMRRYTTFHAKDPIRIAELSHDLPKRWKPVGDALAVMYRTDKWKKDGNDEDYKHLHDKSDGKPYDVGRGVRIYEPVRGAGGQKLPVKEPRALTLLGYCLGVFVRKDDDGDIYEANPRGCYLFSSPDGDMLAVYSPHKQSDGSSGFLAVLAGGNLRVLKDGIDG